MANNWKTVRVFISSTFRDMHAERDHLVTVVFPELRERCESLGLEFFDVDLRWGVPERGADGEKANSWEYCRQWIERVEPLFVCILGQRYGWVPKVEDFKDDQDKARQAAEQRSITDLEVRHAVLDSRRKRRSYFYLRATDAPATASEYVDPPPLSDKLEQLKADVRSCGRPVRDYPCEWEGERFTKLDAFGKMVLEDLWSGVLRDERYVSRDVWHQVLGSVPESDSRYTDEIQPVPRELWEKIVDAAKPPPKDPLGAEREQMEAFAASRLRWFQGRMKELDKLTDFLASTDENAPRLAVVAAVPGQGKSALLAKLSTINHRQPTFQVTHFVGATERSASAHALVERLLGELDRSGIPWLADELKEGEEPKRDFNGLCRRLAQRLDDYSGERQIVILLDALNQLSDGHNLNWLPHRLGPSVRVVVSCIEDPTPGGPGSVPAENLPKTDATERVPPETRVLKALASRHPAPLRVSLGALTEDDVRTIVVAYLKEYCKELDTSHVDSICHMEQARNPLYLLVMLGELRTLGGNDMNKIVGELILALPRDYPDTVSLFRWVLQRLEVFGQEAVRWWCLYLAHGRVGMASKELADLLARKLGPNAAATALLIERGLRRYLLRRGGQLDFFHGQLRQAVSEQYGPQAEPPRLHGEMAEYFTTCAKGADPQKEWETNSIRGFAECIFHLVKAEQHDVAIGLLSYFPFLLHKTRVGLLEGVVDDYEMLCREVPPDMAKRLETWADIFREKGHILRRGNDEWPAHKILLQLVVEHADDSPLTISAEQWLAEGRCDWFWIHRVPRLQHAQKSPCLAVFEGHTGSVFGALELTDGRLLSWSNDGTLRLWDNQNGACLAVLRVRGFLVSHALALADGRLLSASGDKMLRLWDGQSGTCLMLFEGHTDLVDAALELADGRLLSWSSDHTLRLWDSQSGTCLAVLEGHTAGVSGALALADGRLLSWSSDDTLRLWDSQSGTCLAVLEGHTGGVSGALMLADGRLLSWADGLASTDHTLRLWDAQSGACLAILKGHVDSINGALALADERLLSWSCDKTLRLWNRESGACLAVFEGHTDVVAGALALADGRLLSWSWDKTLRLWDGKSSACLVVFEGHTDSVDGALELADGRLLSWSQDKTLRLWDAQNGACLVVLRGHTSMVGGVMVLVDGRLLSWSDDRTLRLWDDQRGACLRELEGHTETVRDALALADGRLLSWAGGFASTDQLRLWDAQSGACLAILKGHVDSINGALALADERLLSWSRDKTLRLWNRESGACLAVFEGHTDVVAGALALADGRLLSWSWDKTLRLWDGKSSACLVVLEGHTGWVQGVLVLADKRLLSWSESWEDTTLRLWNGQSGVCLAVLKGHTAPIAGALALADGRLLSWSKDKTLRLWDAQNGACLAVLEGHCGQVTGGLTLADGRLLSWSEDKTLRLWDAQSGVCLAVLKGHTAWVSGVLALTEGRLLSWSGHEMVLWDSQCGACQDMAPGDQVERRHPEWVYAQATIENPGSVCRELRVDGSNRSTRLLHKMIPSAIAVWSADSVATARCLLPDGTVVITQDKEVCILKIFHGNRRISLAEAEAMLAERGKLSTLCDQMSVSKTTTP